VVTPPKLRPVRDDVNEERLISLARAVLAFDELVDVRARARWFKVPRPDLDALVEVARAELERLNDA
jgi:hypothetical protein